jgi:hypothetical protein
MGGIRLPANSPARARFTLPAIEFVISERVFITFVAEDEIGQCNLERKSVFNLRKEIDGVTKRPIHKEKQV